MAIVAIGRFHPAHRRTHRRSEQPCPMCLAAAQPHVARPRDTRFKPVADALLPWLLAFGLVALLAIALEDAARVFCGGLAGGLLVGAVFAWQLHGRDRATGLAATARVRAELSAESDSRANAVLVQFEWAVNDIAVLRAKLETAEREMREHAQHAFAAERDVRRLERIVRSIDRRGAVRAVTPAAIPAVEPGSEVAEVAQPETIPLRCALNDSGPLAWLELGSDDPDNLPSRVRVFERDGNVICVSDPAVHGVSRDGEPRSASLRIPLPPHLASAARNGALDAYRFEALVAHRWLGVRLTGTAPKATPSLYRDKRGRVYRRG